MNEATIAIVKRLRSAAETRYAAGEVGISRLLVEAATEMERQHALLNNPQTVEFIEGVRLETAHQRERWGEAHDRSKSAENWYWLVGYLAGKALRAAISGDREKARHHTISSASALANWHAAISQDQSGCGLGQDVDLRAIESQP